ncbi:MAG: glycosyltransferase family 2 protein, partial [Rhodothermales bacterium]
MIHSSEISRATPRVSVVVRSMGRLDALIELINALLRQEHDNFEIVIIEQTPDPDPPASSELDSLASDPRVRLLKTAPLGGPGARNMGVREAKGQIVILIDDDDLPVGTGWIRAHEDSYRDANLVGLTGKHVRSVGERCPYIRFLRPFIRARCMRYSVLKTPYTYARFDEDIDGVDWLHGTNSSFRTEIAFRSGLWDTTVSTQDEHSFAFRLHRVLRSNEFLAFRTGPVALRRLQFPGGLEKRRASLKTELSNHLAFVNRVVRVYYRRRFYTAFPLYLGWAFFRTLAWIWDRSRPRVSVRSRIWDSLRLPLL